MIAYSRSSQPDISIIIIHNLTRANQPGGLDTPLELIPTIEVQQIPLILLLDCIDNIGKVDQPTLLVYLISINSEQAGGVELAMDIIGADNHDRGFEVDQVHWQDNQQHQAYDATHYCSP